MDSPREPVGAIQWLTNGREYEVRIRVYNRYGGNNDETQRTTPTEPTPQPPPSSSPIAGFILMDGDDGMVVQVLTDHVTPATGLGNLGIRAGLAGG